MKLTGAQALIKSLEMEGVEVVFGCDIPCSIASDTLGQLRVVDRLRDDVQHQIDARGDAGARRERGLLGLAFHPSYASNGRFYVDYTDRNGDTRVVQFRSNGVVRKCSSTSWNPPS